MTILPYRNVLGTAISKDDGSTSLGSDGSTSAGDKTDTTESISMSYSDDEDEASLCYSEASTVATPVPTMPMPGSIDEGFVVEAPSADDCSVLSLDHSCSSLTATPEDVDSYFLEPSVVVASAITSSNKQGAKRNSKPRRNLIGLRDSCKRLHGNNDPKVQTTKTLPKKNDDAASKSAEHVPSIGMGQSSLQITCVLKEGWLYKKGTGGDILGRDGWKHRYAFLVLATNRQTNQPIEVPVLLIYRNTSATMPSNIIPLDSAVVIATGQETHVVDANGPSTCFDVIQAKASKFFTDNTSSERTRSSAVAASRSFAASKEDADAWIDKMNTTLLQFEKRRVQACIVAPKKVDDTKLNQIVAENHWLDIPAGTC